MRELCKKLIPYKNIKQIEIDTSGRYKLK